VSYQISGASGEVETEVQYEYSDATIPEGEPLDQTVEGAKHDGNGEYTQAHSMPDSLVSEILQNPKNLTVTFRATDTGSDGRASREYELNFADSYMEQIQRELFTNSQMVISEANLQNLTVEKSIIDMEFNSNYEIGSQNFNDQLGNFIGLYSSNVGRSRIPYKIDLTVTDKNGEVYEKNIEPHKATSYLNGEITQRDLRTQIMFNQLWTE
jgi:hypothetical protein